MKRNNLFLLAFVSILVQIGIAGFSWPAVGALGLVIALIGLQDYLEVIKHRDEVKPLTQELNKVKQELEKLKLFNENKLEEFGAEINNRLVKMENSSKMAVFQAKK